MIVSVQSDLVVVLGGANTINQAVLDFQGALEAHKLTTNVAAPVAPHPVIEQIARSGGAWEEVPTDVGIGSDLKDVLTARIDQLEASLAAANTTVLVARQETQALREAAVAKGLLTDAEIEAKRR